MKSSSQYFPVALMQADFWKEYSEDVYLLKPNSSEDKTIEFALTRLYDIKNLAKKGASYIFVHDTYENRMSWISHYEELLSSLIGSGADIWIFEMRGHGLSPKNQSYQRNTLNDVAEYDLPAVQTFVHELTGLKAVWVGKGEGAVAILRAIEAEMLKKELVAQVHLLSLDRFHWFKRYWIPLWGLVTRLLNRNTYFTKQGLPETEFRSVWKQVIKEKSLLGRRKTIEGKTRLFKKINELEIPLMFWFAKGQKERFKKWYRADLSTAKDFSLESFEDSLKEQIKG